MLDYQKVAILQVLPSLNSGGVERGVIDISQAIIDNDMNSVVASAGGKMSSQLSPQGARHCKLPLDSKNPITMIRNILALRYVIRKHNVQIVHARSRAPAWSAYFAAKLEDVHFVTTFHGRYNYSSPIKKFYNSIMARGEKVIAVSNFIKEHVMSNYGVAEEKIEIVHRGANLEEFDPELVKHADVTRVRRELKIPKAVPVVLLPGRMSRWKGQIAFIKAAIILKKDTDFYGIIVGDILRHPNYVKELRNLIAKYGLQDKIYIAGPYSDMKTLYAASDIVLSASIEPEAFGRVAIEGQAMKKMVIATNIGGACETVENDKTGMHVAPGDPHGLAVKIKEAIGYIGTDIEKVMTEEARDSVHKSFSLEIMRNKVINIYKEML